MQFENKTPFPALAFAGVDQHGQAFHVVVVRQTMTWDAESRLHFAAEQAPLAESPEPFDDGTATRQESDLCPFKPRADVIVNAVAHAPRGQAADSWSVRLTVRRPDTPAPLPERPDGLNQRMAPAPETLARWQQAVAHAQAHPIPGEVLIDKILRALGPRSIRAEFLPLRLAGDALRVLSLGLLPSPQWRLTEPAPATQVPVRMTQAYGGEALLTLQPGDPASRKAAGRVPKAHWIQHAQLDALSQQDGAARAVAHDALAANPYGVGLLRAWHWKATHGKQLPAPQIEHPKRPLTAALLQQAAQARRLEDCDARLSPLAVGLGVRPTCHPERRSRVGTVDQAFIDGTDPLPQDFDFSYWNAAWPDQQVPELRGDEIIELTNLCAPDAPGALVEPRGDSLLRLRLPAHTVQVFVRLHSGEMFMQPMRLDTLLIEPETLSLSLVWRIVLAKDEEAPIRLVEAFALDAQRTRELREEAEFYGRLFEKVPVPAPAPTSPVAQESAHG